MYLRACFHTAAPLHFVWGQVHISTWWRLRLRIRSTLALLLLSYSSSWPSTTTCDRCCVVGLLVAGRHFGKLCRCECVTQTVNLLSLWASCSCPPAVPLPIFNSTITTHYFFLWMFFSPSSSVPLLSLTWAPVHPSVEGGKGLVPTFGVSLLCFPSVCLLGLSTTLTEMFATDLRFLAALQWILPVGFLSLFFYCCTSLSVCSVSHSLPPSLLLYPSFLPCSLSSD